MGISTARLPEEPPTQILDPPLLQLIDVPSHSILINAIIIRDFSHPVVITGCEKSRVISIIHRFEVWGVGGHRCDVMKSPRLKSRIAAVVHIIMATRCNRAGHTVFPNK